MTKKEIQEVKVWVSVSGSYCAFHEIFFTVQYDITNNKQLGDMTLDELSDFEHEPGDYADYETRDAILVNGTYYVQWE